MKKILGLALVIASLGTAYAYTYDKTLPVQGKTAADEQMQAQITDTVYLYSHRVALPECDNFAIKDTEISKAKEAGNWQEIWTVDVCSKKASIPINFITKEDGTILYAIDYMNVKVSDK